MEKKFSKMIFTVFSYLANSTRKDTSQPRHHEMGLYLSRAHYVMSSGPGRVCGRDKHLLDGGKKWAGWHYSLKATLRELYTWSS